MKVKKIKTYRKEILVMVKNIDGCQDIMVKVENRILKTQLCSGIKLYLWSFYYSLCKDMQNGG